MEFETLIEKLESTLWGYHIKIEEDKAKQFESCNRRVNCTLNDTVKFNAAIISFHGSWMILINKKIRNKLGLIQGEPVKVFLEADESTYGMPVPPEFDAVMGEDPDAFDWFQKLTPGKQRSLLHIVGKVKNSDSRIKKALAIAEHLNEAQGVLDYKRLNVLIKKYNNIDKM